MFLIAAIATVALRYVYYIIIYIFTFYYLKLIFVLLAKLKKKNQIYFGLEMGNFIKN